MIPRLLLLPHDQSFFLFGPRGTGKTTLLQSCFHTKNSLFLNLLNPTVEARFARDPSELAAIVKALPPTKTHIVIDEVQKVPKLLDVVHYLIEENPDKHFVLSGSSARKLKHGGANLLAGRAFVYALHPLSYLELGESFVLEEALHWGLLPKEQQFTTPDHKMRFLQAYAHTYLKEEIWAEHFVQNLDPFRRFLEVAAQMNGKIIHFARIARDVGVDDKTVKKYYSLLEDTWLGFFLEGFVHSFRKRLSVKPKFYFFDGGVNRALAQHLSAPLLAGTSGYGEAFEQFVIIECLKLASYYKNEFRFSYLKTKEDAEIDLVIERPGQPKCLIEIKSATQVTPQLLAPFIRLSRELPDSEAICLSRDPFEKQMGHVRVLPWQLGIKQLFIGGNYSVIQNLAIGSPPLEA